MKALVGVIVQPVVEPMDSFTALFLLPSMALLKMTRHSTGFSTKSAVSVARAGSTMKGTRNMRTENPEIAIREKEKVA